MDLFIVHRYNENEDEPRDTDKETKILQRLKEKIAQRKKTYISTSDLNNVKEVSLKYPESTNTLTDLQENEQRTNENKIFETKDNTDEPIKKDQKERSVPEFKILGGNEFEKKIKVKRILPHWLSHPFAISKNLKDSTCRVIDLDWLHPVLKDTLKSEGIVTLFPVQDSVIPFILNEHRLSPPLWPSDICVSAPTGSGKTLAFVLPIVQILLKEFEHNIRALIVLPVQELAAQVAKVFKKYSTKTGIKVALLSPTTPFLQEQQQLVRYTETLGWVSDIDIIVCTAGRLVEHLKNTEGFSLKNLKFLVIDEADRIMDHIQNDWLYHLEKHMKLKKEIMTDKISNLSWNNLKLQREPPQKLLFSATLSQDPEKLEQWGLFQPKLFSVIPKSHYEDDEQLRKYTTPEELKETYIVSEAEEKPLILFHLLMERNWNRVLCFTNSSQAAHRLSVLINKMGDGGLKVAELSSALDSLAREKVINNFHQSNINVLIGTDALARGIDLSNCDHVVSYDPPKNIKTYIHRVGRTGRAGRSGCALTMLLPNQLTTFKDTLRLGGKNDVLEFRVEDEIYEKYAIKYEKAIEETKTHVLGEISSKVIKSISLKRGSKSRIHRNICKKKSRTFEDA